MKITQAINPLFLYRNRSRVVPFLDDRRKRIIRHWKLGPYQNRHQGERCFIIGNGPSLTIPDLEKLKSEFTFAANKIYMAFDRTDWRPSYYVLEDDHMIRQHLDEIRRLKGFVKFVSGDWEHVWGADRETIFYPREMLSREDFPAFSDNPYTFVYCGYMVTYISLQLAFFMGFKNVFLLGVDFSYRLTSQSSNTVTYGNDYPKDHFIPDYFKPGESLHVPQVDRARQAMMCAREFYEARGRKIWNATRGGKLEVFERISLEQAFKIR
jgi:hypothetical protein